MSENVEDTSESVSSLLRTCCTAPLRTPRSISYICRVTFMAPLTRTTYTHWMWVQPGAATGEVGTSYCASHVHGHDTKSEKRALATGSAPRRMAPRMERHRLVSCRSGRT